MYGTRDLLHTRHAVDPLRQRTEHVKLVFDLVELSLPPAERLAIDLTRDQQHRRRRRIRCAKTSSGVDSSWPRDGHRHPHFAGDFRVAIGHVGRSLLVPNVDQPDVVLVLV